jgi:hypothetical protein
MMGSFGISCVVVGGGGADWGERGMGSGGSVQRGGAAKLAAWG